MKIGILTFHNAYNYGAVLQAYATQEIVKSYGHEVEIINYHNKAIDSFYKIRITRRRFYLIPLTFVRIYFLKKRKKFRRSKKYSSTVVLEWPLIVS